MPALRSKIRFGVPSSDVRPTERRVFLKAVPLDQGSKQGSLKEGRKRNRAMKPCPLPISKESAR